jgi:hypothetical protein
MAQIVCWLADALMQHLGFGKKQEAEMLSMTTLLKARICRLYQQAKKGDERAFYSLANIGIKGNKLVVLRKIEEMMKSQIKQVG